MKKTVSVNIKGTNFLIEEDAYELLQDYIDRLTVALQNDEGSQEIIEDVELRIAEICTTKLSETKTVIELKDIEDILAALGDPAEFVDVDEEKISNATSNNESKQSRVENDRRLFRDGDSATLGGVCAGIANYFGIDVVIIRAVFVILFLFGGFGFPLYLILWIIIPKAESTIDKLRMKGRPITVESVKREVEDATEKIKTDTKSFASKLRNDGSYKKRISKGKRIVLSIIGMGFILFGIVNLIAILTFIIGGVEFLPIHGENGFMSMTEVGELLLSNSGDVTLAWVGGLMAWLSLIFFVFLLGSMMIFRIKNRWANMSLGGLVLTGITGIIICSIIGMRTGRDFSFDGEITKVTGSTAGKELVIIPRMNNYPANGDYNVVSDGHFFDMEIDKDRIKSYGIDVQYVQSDDTLFHIIQSKSARANNHKKALKKSENIYHDMELINDTLYVDVEYSYPIGDKLRDQDVTIIIEIPEGSTVRLGKRIVHLGGEDEDESIDHPYYKKQGHIRSDGSYDHYHRSHRHHTEIHIGDDFDDELEREIKEEILEELDLD